MQLGAFSLSLTVSDLARSREFYGHLGFEPIGGDGQTYSIVQNGPTIIGLFQGMFEKNMLTFNPGWDGPHQNAPSFSDVRELRKQLAEAGIEAVDSNTADSPSGPAYFIVVDPDGNPVLVDQHV